MEFAKKNVISHDLAKYLVWLCWNSDSRIGFQGRSFVPLRPCYAVINNSIETEGFKL